MSGLEFEHEVRRSLVANGFKNVETTRKSGDFGADLILQGGYNTSHDSEKTGRCNACQLRLPVRSCQWKTCPNPAPVDQGGKTGKIVIQCKRSAGPVGIKAVQEALGARSFYRAREAWVITDSTYTAAAIKLARSSGVKLKRLVGGVVR